MVQPSPAPRAPRRRRWPWVLGGLGVALAAGGIAVALWLPAQIDAWALERVEGALQRRFTKADVASVDVDWDRIAIRDVHVDDGGATLHFDRIDVSLDPDAWWSLRVDVREVAVQGGVVRGDVDALLSLRDRLQAKADVETDDGAKGRVSLKPTKISWGAIDVDVDTVRDDVGAAHLSARFSGEIDVTKRDVDLRLADVDVALDERQFAARALSTTVHLPEGSAKPAFPLSLRVDGFATAITPTISVAEVEGRVTIDDERAESVDVDLSGGFADEAGQGTADLWSIRGRGRRDLASGEVTVEMKRFELGRVPAVLEKLPLVDSAKATAGGRIELSTADGTISARGELAIAGLNVRHELLAADTVRDVGFAVAFTGDYTPSSHRLAVHEAKIARKGVELVLTGELVHPEAREGRRYDVRVRVPAIPCQTALDAIPRELVPSLRGFELAGDFSMDVSTKVDYANLDALVLDGGVDLWACKVTAVPSEVSSERLNGGFTHRVRTRDGRIRAVHMMTGSSGFTPLPAISPHMVAAVLTTEDGGFWRHRGFNTSQFREALRRNLEAGKVRLGASTITMQMVKNVLLSHERTLSRKLQEVFLTWYVESVLSKQRIMEIYLNAVEFGPGIYGITHAADHYFGKHPSELHSKEAAFLALMLPSPVRRHVHWCHGQTDASFDVKVRRIHSLMHSRGRIDAVEYLTYADAPLVFDRRDLESEASCLAEIDAVLAAEGRQTALSGLLGRHEGAPSIDVEPTLPSDPLDPSSGAAAGYAEDEVYVPRERPIVPGEDTPVLELLEGSEAPARDGVGARPNPKQPNPAEPNPAEPNPAEPNSAEPNPTEPAAIPGGQP